MTNQQNYTNIAGAIFDMDGTILDSTEAWDAVAPDLLRELGYTPKPTLAEDVYPLGTLDIVDFLRKDYNMKEPAEVIYEGTTKRIFHYYCEEAELKPGMKELLEYLKVRGVKLALATATAKEYALPALKLTGVADLFDCILTCDEVGHTKNEPHVFLAAMERMGTEPANTWIFEDALHAARTAKSLGLTACGVADPSADFQRREMMELCDFFLEDTTQWRTLPFVKDEV